ncbi:BamA/TamA family outer membrane protein [Roseospira goensis]|uniref:BamA/TamA family outer membrane protein n=1 Tax=Roseospira goensis TaxID=391922 RepID=UPI001622E7AB
MARALLAAALVLAVPHASLAEEDEPADPRVPYTVEVRVTDPPAAVDLMDAVEGASTLRALEGEPPATRFGLRRRLESDLATVRDVLRAEGFYAGHVDGRIEDGPREVQVVVSVTPGPRYTVAETAVAYTGAYTGAGASGGPASLPASLAGVGLAPGQPATSDAVLAAERALIDRLRAEGRPFAEVVDRRVAVNHARRAMAVRLRVDPGPAASFGGVRIEGLERLKADVLRDLAPWTPGTVFDTRQLDAYRNRILETRLFSSVTVRPAEAAEADGRLPVVVAVTEAPPRSVGGGLRYSTDDGPGVRLYWTHRNLLGRAERLRGTVDLAPVSQTAGLVFEKPWFLHPDQSLRLSGDLERVEREAYTGLTARAGAGVERRLNDVWRLSGGVSLDLARLKDEDGTDSSYLVGVPLGVARETVDDVLDPTAGTRLSLSLTPFAGRGEGAALGFAVADLSGSAYWTPLEDDGLVLAARGRLASLVGAETDAVPPHRRLYAGGGGSVRGYGHQMVGPLDDDGDPRGGRSALELGLEARIKVTDSIGLVPFVDAGLVGDEAVPDLGGDVLWAAGLGARYYTDFGPLRVDIGVPLNPRDADDRFQVYISLGQAF